jgi:hypothetical protein
MATGHATYSTVHADSAKSLIHRLEGKPIEIPRIMLQSLDIVSIHITTRVKGKRVRRCKQIIEIIDIDPTTKEILTNEVFYWDPIEDRFIYTGKSYILEGIRARWDMSKEDITREIRDRAEILEWMNANEVRTYKEVAKAISRYTENPEDFLKKMRNPDLQKKKDDKKEEESSKKKSELSTKKEKTEKELNEMLTSPGENQDWGQDGSEATSENKIVALSDLECIDVKTAVLLQDNSIENTIDLKNASVKDLSKIKGFNKKTAKKIIKELENIASEGSSQDSNEGGERDAAE